MSEPRCSTCHFWASQGKSSGSGPEWGECKRFPPTPDQRAYNAAAIFPKTVGGNWCGEHRPRTPLPVVGPG